MKTTEEIKEICEEINLNMEKRTIDEKRNEILESVGAGVSAYTISLVLLSLKQREQTINAQLDFLHARKSLIDYKKAIERL